MSASAVPRPGSDRKQTTINWQTWKTAGWIFGFYSFFLLLTIPQVYFFSVEAPNAPPWYTFAWRLAVGTYLWARLTPGVFWLGNRLPISSPKLLRNLVLHFVFSLLFAAFQTIAYLYLQPLLSGRSLTDATARLLSGFGPFLNSVTNGFIFYVAILAFNQALIYSRKFRDREFRLQQAELEMLKRQLHPHFLFNTLSAISGLIYVSRPDALKTISELSDLLRITITSDKAQEVSLKEELDFLRKYILIQQTLLQERLEVRWAIEPETLDALLPNMLLQPLVENSIRHGISPKEEGGFVEVSARRTGNELVIDIKDDGLGNDSLPETKGAGIGLVNSKARLKHLYGDSQSFESTAETSGGWRVRITLPFRSDPRSTSSPPSP